MPSLNQLTLSLLLPALVFCVIYTFIAYLWKRDSNESLLKWLLAAAFGIAYIIGYIGLEGKLTLKPIESRHWIFYLTVLTAGTSVVWHKYKVFGVILEVLLSILVPRILLISYYEYSWSIFEGLVWWIGLAIIIFFFLRIVQQSFKTLPQNATIPFVYLGISGGTVLILTLSGSLLLALHSSVLVALLAALWILTIVLPRILKTDSSQNLAALLIGITPVLSVLLVSIWLNGYFYAEVPSVSVLLLVIAPLFVVVAKKKSQLIQIGLIALSVCIAIVVGVLQSGFFSDSAY